MNLSELQGLNPRLRELLREHSFLEERERLEGSLTEFVREAWSQIEPRPLIWGWHIEAICEHMQAFSEGKIPLLLHSMPPRIGKSRIVSILYPAWYWTTHPETRFLMITYGQGLSAEFAVESRRLIGSHWYQERWGNRFHIMEDQDTKLKFDNSKGGYRFSASVQGGVIGRGGDQIIVDEPHDTENVESDTERKKVHKFYSDTLTNRLNNKKEYRVCVSAQRVHEDDLIDYIMRRRPDATMLMAPLEYEAARRCSTIVLPSTAPEKWMDPRHIEGESICPGLFGPKEIADIKMDTTPYSYASRYQQDPQPRSGGVFDIEWFGKRYEPARVERLRRDFDIIQSWDTANKDLQTSAFSVCTTWGVMGAEAYLLDVWRQKVRTDVLETMAKGLSDRWQPSTILIEDKASGTGLINAMRKRQTDEFGRPLKGGATIIAIKISPKFGDKQHRAEATGPFWSQGRGWLPVQAPWLPDWLQEHLRFPNSTYADQVDSTSQFVNWFTKLRLHSVSRATSVVSIYQR